MLGVLSHLLELKAESLRAPASGACPKTTGVMKLQCEACTPNIFVHNLHMILLPDLLDPPVFILEFSGGSCIYHSCCGMKW